MFKNLVTKVIPTQTYDNVMEGAHHPVKWVRGEGIPDGHITPWELLLYAVSQFGTSLSGGYAGQQDFLFKESYRVPARLTTIGGVTSSVWDAINDPILGFMMDKLRLGVPTLRKILRISAVTSNILGVVKMINGGLTPWQHIFLLVFCNMSQDIIGTMAGVADQKIRAGVSPLSQQRGRINVWSGMGMQFAWPMSTLVPTLLMAFRSVFQYTDEQIIFVGACICLPI
ncbi:MAG: hypothetical protein LBS96_07480, partial [Oscillospiraceae bacterium]|nr:hypothetical protein [Oscillospiraceae bacterium]